MSSSTTATISGYYQSIQFRNAPASTLESFSAMVGSGGMTLAQVRQAIIDDTYTTNFVDPVLRLYQAAFGRVPENGGALDFYADRLADGRMNLISISQAFVASPEFQARYGTDATPNAATITALYLNVLGRAPDAAGFQFYQTNGMSTAQMLQAFSQSPEFQTRSNAAVDAFLNANALGTAVFSGPLQITVPGQTFVLTTNADAGAAFAGTSGNDTFNGAIGTNGLPANGTTFNPGDNLDGGAGTDTLNIAISGTNTAAQTTAAITLSGIERVIVSNFETDGTHLSTIDLSTATGVTTLGLSASSGHGDTSFTNVKNIVSAEMSNGAADLTIDYVGGVVVGAADAMSLALSNQTGGTFTAEGIEALNLSSNTAANTIALASAGGALTTVNVTGAAGLSLTSPTSVKAIDASAFTGALTTTLGAGVEYNVVGGSGNDVLSVTVANLTAADSINAGAGRDTLRVDAPFTAANAKNISGFEVLEATANSSTAYNVGALSSANAVTQLVSSSTSATNTVTFSNVTTAVTDIAVTGTEGVIATLALNANSSNDAVRLSYGTAATATAAGSGVTVAGQTTLNDYEAITIVSQGGSNNTGGFSAHSLSSLVVTGDKQLTLGTMDAGNTAIKSIDASGLTSSTAHFIMSNNTSTTASTVLGGAGNDTLFGGTKADSISGGAGVDSITAGGGNDIVSGGTGNDVILGEAGSDNLSGDDGDDTFTVATSAHFVGLSAAETVSGGAGNDTISLIDDAGTTINATDLAAINSIETISFGLVSATGGVNSITLNDAAFTANGATSLAIKSTTEDATLTVDASALSAANSVVVTTVSHDSDNDNDPTAIMAAVRNDNLVGGAGNDTFNFSTKVAAAALDANDTVNGGKGTDTLAITLDTNSLTAVTLTNVSNIERITVTGTGTLDAAITLANANFVTTDTVTTVGVVDASGMTGSGKITVDGSKEADSALSITGGAGNDTLTGGGKADTIIGGNGNNQITGGAGADNLSAGTGNDVFIVGDVTHFMALASVETVDGGAGNDVLRFAANAATSVNSTDLLGMRSIETIEFGGNNTSSIILTDSVFSSNGLTSLTISDTEATKALTVNAAALSAANSLTINANKGADSADTRDSLLGGAGNDTINFTTATAGDALAAGDSVNGGGGVDTLAIVVSGTTALTAVTLDHVSNIERITVSSDGSSTANASITLVDANFASLTGAVINASAFNGALTFSGSSEDDSTLSVTGGSGADNLTGGQKADTIIGGSGNDTITGGLGADVLTGGLGADMFVYAAVAQSGGANIDSVTDFVSGSDRLRLTLDYSALSASNPVSVNATRANSTNANVDGLTAAQALLSGERGQFVYDTTNSRLYVNVNNDNFISTADYTIGINAASTPNATIVNGDIEFDITGTAGADTILGGGANDTINGGDGADSLVGGAGTDSITGGNGNDSINGDAGSDTITGGTGGDVITLTADAARDEIILAGGDTNVTIGGTGGNGTISGFDSIADFNVGTTSAVKDILNFAGTAIRAANAAVNGTDSTLTIAGNAVKSHTVSGTGLATFDDDDTFTTALTVTGQGGLAAVVQYLIGTDIGDNHPTLAFVVAGTDGFQGTYVYSQAADTAGSVGGYQLVQLVGVTATGLETTASNTANLVFIG